MNILLGGFILTLVVIVTIIGLIIYFIPKKLGHPKIAKYLIIIYSFFLFTIILLGVFSDELFSKNDAKKLIEEQQFYLTDDFEILKNETSIGISEYYHTFTLKISNYDKQKLILKIKNSKNFHICKNTYYYHLYNYDSDLGPKLIWNFEAQKFYTREYFKPYGEKEHSPTIRKIWITKKENLLIFQDIEN